MTATNLHTNTQTLDGVKLELGYSQTLYDGRKPGDVNGIYDVTTTASRAVRELSKVRRQGKKHNTNKGHQPKKPRNDKKRR
jgi:hypothetical protein